MEIGIHADKARRLDSLGQSLRKGFKVHNLKSALFTSFDHRPITFIIGPPTAKNRQRAHVKNRAEHLFIIDAAPIPLKDKQFLIAYKEPKGLGIYPSTVDKADRSWGQIKFEEWSFEGKEYWIFAENINGTASCYYNTLKKIKGIKKRIPNAFIKGHPRSFDHLQKGNLQNILARNIKMAITQHSNTVFETLMLGIPSVALHPLSLAYNYCNQDPLDEYIRPSREALFRETLNKQWSIKEIESGEMWAHYRELI